MYEYEGLHHTVFLMLYGCTMSLAIVLAFYLLCRRGNAIDSDIQSPVSLRRWAAAFLLATAMSHLWWYLLGNVWMADNKLLRDTTAYVLDLLTLVPLMMAVLLRMLQDRRRRLWPWLSVNLLVLIPAATGYATHQADTLRIMSYCQLAIIVVFLIYYTRALLQYSRWLLDNFADLEHKEVWQSLAVMVVLFAVYALYTTNGGELYREVMGQVSSLFIFGFLIWRVETLKDLTPPQTVLARRVHRCASGL